MSGGSPTRNFVEIGQAVSEISSLEVDTSSRTSPVRLLTLGTSLTKLLMLSTSLGVEMLLKTLLSC